MILLNQKLTLSSAPTEDEDLTPSDDAVRQALLRMGGSSSPSRRGGEQVSPGGVSADSRRRRFSQNENVPVEYVSRERQGERQGSRHETGEGPDPSAALNRALERERQLRETAERSLQEVRASLQVAQTRLAHLEIDLEEARRVARSVPVAPVVAPVVTPVVAPVEESVAAPPAAPVAAPADEPVPEAPRRGRGRPRLTPRSNVSSADEPEPVKWWIKN
jgi:hypothetical protein